MRKSVRVAVAAAMTVFSSAQANAADVFDRLTSERLVAILQSSGATQIETKKPAEGVEMTTFNDGSGMVILTLLGCKADGCPALQMSVIFEKDERNTLSAINSYNATYLHAQAALMSSGHVALIRLYLPDGGVTENNLRANMQMFVEAPALFEKHVDSQMTAAVATKGTATPVAAPAPATTLKLGGATPLSAGTQKYDGLKWLEGAPTYRKR